MKSQFATLTSSSRDQLSFCLEGKNTTPGVRFYFPKNSVKILWNPVGKLLLRCRICFCSTTINNCRMTEDSVKEMSTLCTLDR